MDYGNKINDEYQNPIDNILLKICKQIAPFLYHNKITPNKITFLGLILGIISIYFFINKKYILSFTFLWLTYFTDCLDGFMARKYNQTTLFGDYFDHFRDHFIVSTLIILVLYRMPGTKNKIMVGILLSIFFFTMVAQMGCQEKITHYKDNNDCLILTKDLCPGQPKQTIQFTKWFGCGTFILVLSLCILSFQSSDLSA